MNELSKIKGVSEVESASEHKFITFLYDSSLYTSDVQALGQLENESIYAPYLSQISGTAIDVGEMENKLPESELHTSVGSSATPSTDRTTATLASSIINSSPETMHRLLKHHLFALIAESPVVLQQRLQVHWNTLCQWHTLNKDLLGLMCRFLCWRDILCALSFICRNFTEILQLHSVCWSHCNFRVCDIDNFFSANGVHCTSFSQLVKQVNQSSSPSDVCLPYALKYIQTIEFDLSHDDTSSDYLLLLPHFKSLREFRWISNPYVDQTRHSGFFSKVLSDLTQLQSLQINSLSKEDLANLAKCSGLKKLRVTQCVRMSKEALETIGEGCPHLTTLVLLELYQVSGESIRNIQARCHNLSYLHLSGARVYILDQLSLDPYFALNLKSALLDISHFQYGQLQVLCLSCIRSVKKDFWISLLNHLPRSIHELQITYSISFDLSDCSAIFPVKTIKSLTVYIPNEKTLANLHKIFPNLTFLSLGERNPLIYDTSISYDKLYNFGIKALASLRECKQLQKLFIKEYPTWWGCEYNVIMDKFPESLFEGHDLQFFLDTLSTMENYKY